MTVAKWTAEKPPFLSFRQTRTRLVKQCSGCKNGGRHCSYCRLGTGTRCTCSGYQCRREIVTEWKVPGT